MTTFSDAAETPVVKKPFFSLSADEWAAWCAELGEPPYRSKQLRQAVVTQRISDFHAATALPLRLREKLAAEVTVFGSRIHRASHDSDTTEKLLVQLVDGQTIECVLLKEDERRTVCLSTQVGCAMGCVFCASGLNGVERNLHSWEMIEELVLLRNLLPKTERLSHIVVMGMGEPMLNLANLLPVLEFASSKDGLGIGARHITVSTVGLPNKIRELAAVGKPYHLAVSLHAPNPEVRRRIVPTAEKIDLDELLAASDEYRSKTGRQVTFEYVMLQDVNDHPEHAVELAALLAGRDAMINLIPYNPVAGLPWGTPTAERCAEFALILRSAGFAVKTRKRKGASINAACGQLRRTAAAEQEALVVLQ
ncbi:MAG: 23S rRNA (adenine(2503)-C(2))-methyltransferase RlmN [Planctomycetia bacterium]